MEEQIIEIFGKRVKIVKDKKTVDCEECAFCVLCTFIDSSCLCEDTNKRTNRHFVEVDEDGNEIKQ